MAQKIALIAKSAGGKDTVKNLLIKKGLIPEVSYTTRPPRKGEVDGVSYHFKTEEEFHSIEMLEKVCFNGWWYGTGKDQFAKSEIFVFTPKGLALLPKENRKELLAVYLIVDSENQLKRLEKRGDDLTELQRRIDADEADFKDYKDFNISFNTAMVTAEEIADYIFTFYTKIAMHEVQLKENHRLIDHNEPVVLEVKQPLNTSEKITAEGQKYLSDLINVMNVINDDDYIE
jgi:guanylate kinase